MERIIFFPEDHLVYSLQSGENHSYSLFQSISGVYPFVKFEEEIAYINDYCCFSMENLRKHLTELGERRQVKIIFTEKKRRIEEYALDDIHSPEYDYELGIWEYLSTDIHRCTMLLLWLSYLESSLDEIAKWFCAERAVPLGQKPRGISNVAFRLDRIGACCGCDLLEKHSADLAYYKKIQKIRNSFVHREWEQISGRHEQFRLDEVIHLVSSLIQSIEEEACHAGIITEFSF